MYRALQAIEPKQGGGHRCGRQWPGYTCALGRLAVDVYWRLAKKHSYQVRLRELIIVESCPIHEGGDLLAVRDQHGAWRDG
jgi:hypothetical protein